MPTATIDFYIAYADELQQSFGSTEEEAAENFYNDYGGVVFRVLHVTINAPFPKTLEVTAVVTDSPDEQPQIKVQ